jgi:hypothetical protein
MEGQASLAQQFCLVMDVAPSYVCCDVRGGVDVVAADELLMVADNLDRPLLVWRILNSDVIMSNPG